MKEVNQYSDQFKKLVVQEVLAGQESLEYYRRKFKIGGSMTISRWIDKFAEEQEEHLMAKKRQESEELAALRAELVVTKRAYEEERLKRQAYEVMIELAEAEFKISIGKKFGAKQSKK